MTAKGSKYSKKYSPEFKISVILDMLENKTSYNKISKKYGITGHHTVKNWISIYQGEGSVGFYENRCEEAMKMEKSKRGRPRKKTEAEKEAEKNLRAELEKVRKENEWLRMENAYLKKLDALIQAEEQKQKR